MMFPSLVEVSIVQEGPTREYVRVPISLELVHHMGKDALWRAFLEAYYIATGEHWHE